MTANSTTLRLLVVLIITIIMMKFMRIIISRARAIDGQALYDDAVALMYVVVSLARSTTHLHNMKSSCARGSSMQQ